MQQIAMAHWAHDIRNALGTVALYVETLERPADPQSSRAVALTHALLAKAAAMCSSAVRQAGQNEFVVRRSGVDAVATIRQVRDLVAPTLPASASLEVIAPRPVNVLADAQDLFRILFNLVHNAATIARRSATLRRIRIRAECVGTAAIITVADDGPGLPDAVRARLFRRDQSASDGHGYGLTIARELAERNGGMLELGQAPKGTIFLIELPLEAVPSGYRRKT